MLVRSLPVSGKAEKQEEKANDDFGEPSSTDGDNELLDMLCKHGTWVLRTDEAEKQR
jgi:hypothetical protein